jgi:hypothetical protein
MLGASRVVDSDSDGDFPASVGSSDAEGHEHDSGDDSSVASDEFHDAFAKKPVTRVKMGEAKRSALKGSMLGSSSYGYVFVLCCIIFWSPFKLWCRYAHPK